VLWDNPAVRRHPAVAGQFYSADAVQLAETVSELMHKVEVEQERAIGVLSPHAGIMYSGGVAAAVFAAIQMPETFILLGPNHTGLGADVALVGDGEWEVPTGVFTVDRDLAQSILSRCPLVVEDAQAHLFEHSLEVQLPFLAARKRDARIVPIAVMRGGLSDLMRIGTDVAAAVTDFEHPVVIVASSDMSHYVSDSEARKKDRLVIDRVLALDPEGLYETVKEHNISMCGYMPTIIMLSAAKSLGASGARLVKYITSGEMSGDYDQVVGYAGIVIT
jgi:AmmeMemoRadiSam system protein B